MERRTVKRATKWNYRPALWVLAACVFSFLLPLTTRSQTSPTAHNLIPGQTATRLSDGRWLLVGGESAGGGLNTASLWNPQTNNTTQLSATPARGRAWHSATMLPDGQTRIYGGTQSNQSAYP